MDKILQAAFKCNTEEIFIHSSYLWRDSPMEFIHLYPPLICDRINVGQIRVLRLVDGTEFPIPHNKETGKAYIASPESEGNGIVLKKNITPVDKNISVSIKNNKSPNGAIAYTIQCTGDSCIDSLKKRIARIENTDFKLMFNGVYLDDDSKPLKDIGITHGSVISVVTLDQIKAKARSILTTWLSMVRAFPHGGPEKQTEEQRLIKLRDQAAAAMMEKDIGFKQIYVFFEKQLETLYARAREIRGA
jgi:hypothetical protein